MCVNVCECVCVCVCVCECMCVCVFVCVCVYQPPDLFLSAYDGIQLALSSVAHQVARIRIERLVHGLRRRGCDFPRAPEHLCRRRHLLGRHARLAQHALHHRLHLDACTYEMIGCLQVCGSPWRVRESTKGKANPWRGWSRCRISTGSPDPG